MQWDKYQETKLTEYGKRTWKCRKRRYRRFRLKFAMAEDVQSVRKDHFELCHL